MSLPRSGWKTLLPILLLAAVTACQKDAASAGGPKTAEAADTTQAKARVEPRKDAKKKGPLGFLLNRGKKRNERKPEDPVPVEIAAVQVRELPTYLTGTATLEPEQQAEILAKSAGQILALQVEEGDWVEEGATLALVESESQEVALEEATVLARARKSDLERARALHAQDLASDKDLADAQAAHDQAEAARKGAALSVARTRVVAPFAGRVAERRVDRGQNVTPGTPLFSLVDPEPLLASIHLPEREVSRVAVGQAVVIVPDGGARYAGMVIRISPVVDQRTGTVKVTCRVAERMDGGTAAPLRPGSFARVKIPTAVHTGARVLPRRAVVPEGGETYVWKVVADSVVKIPVLTGPSDEQWVEIVAGLEPEDEVVAVGQGALRSGSRLRRVTSRDTTTTNP